MRHHVHWYIATIILLRTYIYRVEDGSSPRCLPNHMLSHPNITSSGNFLVSAATCQSHLFLLSVDWALGQLSEEFIQTSELQNKSLQAKDIQYLKLDFRS
jgi:hypothetical protein